MAFVFRAPRFRQGPGADALGPGSYNIIGHDDAHAPRRAAVGMAPFNSTAARIPHDPRDDVPGPGAYLPVGLPAATRSSPASAAFRSTAARSSSRVRPSSPTSSLTSRRFATPNANASTPVSFIAHTPWEGRSAAASGRRRRRRAPPVVSWVRVSTAPSIPARAQSHGYVENAHGDLESRPAPFPTRTGVGSDRVGPADYQVDDRALRVTKTCDFGRSRSVRAPCRRRATSTPGPGAHSIPDPWQAAGRGASFTGGPERFVERPATGPAPGQYDVAAQRSAARRNAIPKEQQAFSRWSDRWRAPPTSDAAPGVGAYDLRALSSFQTATDVKLRRAALGIKDSAPFLTGAVRFQAAAAGAGAGTPGPGAYAPEKAARGDPDLEAYKRSRRSGFGVGAERYDDDDVCCGRLLLTRMRSGRFPSRSTVQGDVPGPGAYTPPVHVEPRYKSGRPTGAFQSKTKRVLLQEAGQDAPPPTAYNLMATWAPKKRLGSAGHVFISGQKRFADGPTSQAPGPGAYAAPDDKAGRARSGGAVSAFRSRSSRFADGSGNGVPGVGSYDLVDDDALLKRSFNITVGNDYR